MGGVKGPLSAARLTWSIIAGDMTETALYLCMAAFQLRACHIAVTCVRSLCSENERVNEVLSES